MSDPSFAFREVEAWFEQATSEDNIRRIFVQYSTGQINDFDQAWAGVLGERPDTQTFVDGKLDAPLGSVSVPDGRILHRVSGSGQVAERAIQLYRQFTKVRSGEYFRNLRVSVNGTLGGLRDPNPRPGQVIEIVDIAVFARRAEVRGYNDIDGSGFPDGLMAGIAAILRKEFRGLPTRISSSWDDIGGERLPLLRIQ